MNTEYKEHLYDQQYIRNKRTIKMLRKRSNEQALYLRIVTIIAVGLLAILLVAVFRIHNLLGNIDDLNAQVETVNQEKLALEQQNIELQVAFDACSELLYDVSEIAIALDDSNAELLNTNAGLNEILNGTQDRLEVYEKYNYAFVREDGSRTELRYDQVKSLQEMAEEKGMTDESIDLILSIVMTESNGIEAIKSENSSATGYGQFLSSTGEFVWERLMGNENYTHDLAENGDINLTMMVEYLCYLDNKYNGNMNLIINEYRGIDSISYKEKINQYLSCSNNSLATVQITR